MSNKNGGAQNYSNKALRDKIKERFDRMTKAGAPFAVYNQKTEATPMKAKSKDINQFQEDVANLYVLPSVIKQKAKLNK